MTLREFSLVSTLTVAQNTFLDAEPYKVGLIDNRAIVKRARKTFGRMQVSAGPK